MNEEKAFRVVHVVPRYCQVTDAIIGSRHEVWSTWDTRDEASAAVDECLAAFGYDPEECFEVLPRETEPVREASVDLASEEIPF